MVTTVMTAADHSRPDDHTVRRRQQQQQALVE
jgi:hypothetical protein